MESGGVFSGRVNPLEKFIKQYRPLKSNNSYPFLMRGLALYLLDRPSAPYPETTASFAHVS
jgi:hypothetical protein